MLRTLLTLMLTLALGATAQALSLGEAKVRSYLGQPLLVEIPLPGLDHAEGSVIRAAIGSPQDFKHLSLEYQHETATLKVTPTERDGNWMIRITSRRAFKQPILQFPLSVANGESTLLRAYTLLIDPPNYRLAGVTPTQATLPGSRQNPDGVRVEVPRRPRQQPTVATDYSPYTYQIGPGETLWPIAAEFKPLNSSTPRMMRAIVAANPEAFENGDMNRLRAGSLLRIPNVPWGKVRAYERPTGGTPTVTSKPANTATLVPDTSPEPLPPQQPVVQDTEQSAVVEVIGKGTSQSSPEADLKQQVLLTHEEVEKNRLEQQQIRGQIEDLRQELAQLQRLMKLKDQQIATLQAVVAAQQQVLERPPVPASPETDDPAPQAADTTPEASQPESSGTASPLAAVSEPDPKPESQPASLPVVKATPPVTTAEPRESFGFSFWWLLGMLPLALILLLGWWWRRRQQRKLEGTLLGNMPEISEAPPAPYTNEVRTHRSGTGAASTSTAPRPPVDTQHSSLATPIVEEVTEPDESLNESLNESFEELTSAFPELEELVIPESESAPTMLDVPEDEHFSEDELAELAEQLTRDLENEPEADPGESDDAIADDDLEALLKDSIEPEDEELPLISLESDVTADEIDESLDLAQAYIAVGDREAAVEILQEALRKTSEPEKRSFIEDLLAQTG